ncbi:hypothetical protein NC653_035659 [Populus alba x Populus x berolinensis]|uniref:Uncharacterized protein n=1 Tax=Populus alba x Populus x berolinensis TaxID=444605 RepID=A0AAD6PTS7_9ROSI|nr:hypothetical protein NC653_035659 [Populus alba x Populus x berolinensis]
MATTLAVDLAVSHSFCNYLQPLFCILGSMYKTGDMTLVHFYDALKPCWIIRMLLLILKGASKTPHHGAGKSFLKLANSTNSTLEGKQAACKRVKQDVPTLPSPYRTFRMENSLVHTYKLNSYLEVFISIAVGKPSQRLTISSIPYQM